MEIRGSRQIVNKSKECPNEGFNIIQFIRHLLRDFKCCRKKNIEQKT